MVSTCISCLQIYCSFHYKCIFNENLEKKSMWSAGEKDRIFLEKLAAMTLTDKRGEQGKGGAESLQALSVTLLFSESAMKPIQGRALQGCHWCWGHSTGGTSLCATFCRLQGASPSLNTRRKSAFGHGLLPSEMLQCSLVLKCVYLFVYTQLNISYVSSAVFLGTSQQISCVGKLVIQKNNNNLEYTDQVKKKI